MHQAWTSFWEGHRGANGSPKSGGSLNCGGKSCVELGSQGPLIEELNIRLMGFGGTLEPRPPEPRGAKTKRPDAAPMNMFTTFTQAAVKQFQRDYMKVPETGKVCGSLLVALDAFRADYQIAFDPMKCQCGGGCAGFGNLRDDSSFERILADGKPIGGHEFPGMHRSIFWALRAARFYLEHEHSDLGFKFIKISSGYRCWHRNKQEHYTTVNHMGRALDIQFSTINNGRTTNWRDTDKIRQEIFVKCMKAQMGWRRKNVIGLEVGGPDPHTQASTWVHADVREFEDQYQDYRLFAITQEDADGEPLVAMATRYKLFSLATCQGGVPPIAEQKQASTVGDRIPIKSCSLSAEGLAFIKGWEAFAPMPMDSSGHCTVGYGHQIAPRSCSSIRGTPLFAPFAHGLSETEAEAYLKNDIISSERMVRTFVQVPMYQYEYDALVSLIFNITTFDKCPKLLSKLNMGLYPQACLEFADITNDGLSGLVARRQAEIQLFNKRIYRSSH